MPLRYVVLDDGGVLRTGEGVLTAGDVIAVNEALYSSHDRIRAITYQISDYSAVELVDISSEEVLGLSRADQEAARINPDMVVAVVGKRDVMFGLLRMWELFAGESPMQAAVFRDLEQARKWVRQRLQADGA